MKNEIILAALGLTGLVLAGEIMLRGFGFIDFPIYHKSNELGYAALPNQYGRSFRGEWNYNNYGMPTARIYDFLRKKDHVLLVGDSLVEGLLASYSQSESLPSHLQRITQKAIVPIGVGSWALQNELAFLAVYPEVLEGSSEAIFILNNADLGRKSEWTSELRRPTQPPASAILYLIKKRFFPRPPIAESAPADFAETLRLWKSFVASYGRPVNVIVLPTTSELRDENGDKSRLREMFSGLEVPGAKVNFDLLDNKTISINRLDNVHPSAQGNARLAALIEKIVWN